MHRAMIGERLSARVTERYVGRVLQSCETKLQRGYTACEALAIVHSRSLEMSLGGGGGRDRGSR
eukprot:2700428-Prymnesium_polylepis.1